VYVCDITMGEDNPSDALTSRFIAADLPETLTEKAADARFIFGIRAALTEDGIRTYPVYVDVDQRRMSAKEGQDMLEAFKEDFAHWFGQAEKSWKKSLAKLKRQQKPDHHLDGW
jgi:hypothetical protein